MLLVLAEHLGDPGDGVDRADRGHGQAALAVTALAAFHFHGRSSSRRGTHPARAADQVAVLRLMAGLRDHALARAATAFACSSRSSVLGSKGSPAHWIISAWLSCFGSAIASRNSA